jgi:hypothetical protein
MIKPAPKIDTRSAADISKQLQDLLQIYAPDWNEFEVDPVTGNRQPKGISAALIGVCARFSEIIIQRLNQVPDKNFLAFLNLLGASRLPPQPARVPLTFSLATGSTVDAVVPAGTQVAAPPTEGEKEPIIFETDRELIVTAAQLQSVFVREANEDKFSNYSSIIETANLQGVPIFQGNQLIEHIFYIGHDWLFGFPEISKLDLNITLKQPNSESKVAWEFWNSETQKWEEKQPTSTTPAAQKDAIQNLQQSGIISFTNIKAIPITEVNSLKNRWLRCRLTKPITPTSSQPGKVSVNQLPTISSINLQATLTQTELAIESAFTNQLSIDFSKSFFPFGEKPKFGDALYLANRNAFSKKGAIITLKINLADPASAGITNKKDDKDLAPELTWEFWNGKTWKLIGISTIRGSLASVSASNPFQDTTQAFTQIGDGIVSFIVPDLPQTTTINGVENFWIRVRISKGGYGREAQYVPTNNQNVPFTLQPATFVPPIINTLTIDYSFTTPDKPEPPKQIVKYNDFVYVTVDPNSSFDPFQATADIFPKPQPKLYFGLTLPADRTVFPNQPLSLYVRTPDFNNGNKTTIPVGVNPQLVWQYWNGSQWNKLTVRDDSENFSRSGLVEFLAPSDISIKTEFGLSPRYWLRVVWESSLVNTFTQISQGLLNTTIASQTITITNEILGSSNATENQVVRTTRSRSNPLELSPVLQGQHLQVREPELPPAQEQDAIKQQEGDNAISLILDATGRPLEIWVQWHEVPDFYGSGARDRHYVLNHLTGEIQFGNGLNGLIPPAGVGNLRMTRYQTGGGTIGNRAADTIVQLKTTVPYIEKVTNPEAATGGAEAESLESLLERIPRTIRHRGRAVTLEDYEDLAKLATPAVARAKGVALRSLQLSNDTSDAQKIVPGAISVIVVPHSTAAKPLPSLEVLNRIQDYLEANGTLTAKVSVVPPRYLSVSITTEIALTSLEGASAVERAVERQLASFLHPLTGGVDGKGWDFGREPYKSDFYRQIESVSGVDHIRSLTVKLTIDGDEDPQAVQAIQQTGLYLVHSGKHTINLVFEES